MSDVNWNNVVSAVATEEGLLVTERGADGMVGATPKLLRSMQSAGQRQVPRLGVVRTYVLMYEALKRLKKPGVATMIAPPTMTFEATEVEALNWLQSGGSSSPPGYCARLYHLEPLSSGGAAATPMTKIQDWTSCPQG